MLLLKGSDKEILDLAPLSGHMEARGRVDEVSIFHRTGVLRLQMANLRAESINRSRLHTP